VFTDGLNPLQVSSAWIELFYDHLVQTVDIRTAHLRICGLKKFFAGIRRVVPFYTSPFETMSASLKRKLRAGKKKPTVRVLSQKETTVILTWLEKDRSKKGLINAAMIKMLLTSGLRAAELCSLRWGDIEEFDSKLIARFYGKGGEEARQELYDPAVRATRKAFMKLFKREPQTDEFLFYSLPAFPGDPPRLMTPHRLWVRIKEAGEQAKAYGIIKRDIYQFYHS
jgi:integrase